MLSGCSYADVAKLVYAIDLGSIGRPCRFESCHPHQILTAIVKNAIAVFVKRCHLFVFQYT